LSVIFDVTKLPTSDELNQLSREELLALVLLLVDEVQTLRAEVEQLKGPPPTSRNSSQPPSRDWKANRSQKRAKPQGAKPGHTKMERSLVDAPDRVVVVKPETCGHCGGDLQAVEAQRMVRRQLTELPEIRPVVIETQQYEVVCPACHTVQQGTLPAELAASRHFGPRLEALVTYLHHEQHISFERLQILAHDVLGLDLSEGGAVAIIERAGAAAHPLAEDIGEQVRHSTVIGSDETSARVHGRNHWEWVFVSGRLEYHLIAASRGQDVVDTFMGECGAEVWISDCWAAQLNAPAATHQLCLQHQLRNLQRLIDQRPRLQWAQDLQDLFRAAIRLSHRREQLTPQGFQGQVTRLEKRLDRLLVRPLQGANALKLKTRYQTHRDHLFVFLQRPDVAADNNACERALRPSVIHRKVMGSFRSDWGPRAYAALATVINTAKRRGENVFEKLVNLMGQPVLHYLTPSEA
jgi:transposase